MQMCFINWDITWREESQFKHAHENDAEMPHAHGFVEIVPFCAHCITKSYIGKRLKTVEEVQ